MDQQEFRLLKQQLKSGENHYLKLFFEDYGPYCISNIQRKFGCSRADANGVFVESLINLRSKILSGKVIQLKSVRNYLYSTCVNMMKEHNHYAEKRVERAYEVRQFLYEDDRSDAEDGLMDRCLRSFQQLGTSCQEILRYFYIYKLTMHEIADRMNLGNANSAKVKKARCYKKWLEAVKKN